MRCQQVPLRREGRRRFGGAGLARPATDKGQPLQRVLNSAFGQFATEAPLPASPQELVERFYNEVWNSGDERVARDILAADFRFRASLGPERRGPDGFIDYLRAVRAAVAHFTCTIEQLIATDDRAAARMMFRGIHRAKFFGVEPTGRAIRWAGAAFFAAPGGRITELWVLGDVDDLRRQLTPQRPTEPFLP